MSITLLSYYIEKNTPVFGGKLNSIKISSHRSISNGNTTNELLIELPNHVGTHIDLPKHFSNNGPSLSNYNPNFWNFNKVGFVHSTIENFPEDIKDIDENIEILIWKTGFGKFRHKEKYWKNQPIIPAEFANILRRRFTKLRVFGFDMISLTSLNDKEEGKKAHLNFLVKNDIVVIEDMNLQQLNASPNKVIMSPWLLIDADGVPCTVYAFTE
jgi:arylformamidase